MALPLLLPALISGGSTLLSGILEGIFAKKASDTQAGAAQKGIDEQTQQLDAMRELLKPYIQAGESAISKQQALMGLQGTDAQQAAIAGIASSPEMLALTKQGEESILQQAAATGGLRGGNVQGALAQFRPQLLSSLINQQYQRLGGVAQLGQGTAMGLGSAGLQTGQGIAALYGEQGAAQAGGELAKGKAWMSIPNAFMAGLGTYTGLGGQF